MTDVAVDTLRLRGPSGRRLAHIAATALPRALERALDGIGDVEIACVSVILDLDPDDYDDETLAVLWADAIRVRVLEAARARGGCPPARREPKNTAPQRSGAPNETEGLVAAVHSWLDAHGSDAVVLPHSLLALGDATVAAEVRARLMPNVWLELCNRVSRTLRRTSAMPQEVAPPPIALPRTSTSVAADAASHTTAPASSGTEQPGASGGQQPGQPTHATSAIAALADLAPLAADCGEGLHPATVTGAAGLVLLYPWLADHCRGAEALHPTLDPLDVREAALALVVDPGDPGMADDPLVAFLAGRPAPDIVRRERISLLRADDVTLSAERVLASFAAVVRGFERSSARFIRDGWISRLGVLDTDRDPALLTAAIHPLDVVLPLLPYPVGLLKLPWSPPIIVRFR